jgi:hypothetical protein
MQEGFTEKGKLCRYAGKNLAVPSGEKDGRISTNKEKENINEDIA